MVGSGSWGTTLAVFLADKGLDCRLWVHKEPDALLMSRLRQNTRFLPGVVFPNGLSVAADLAAALSDADLVLLAVPMHSLARNLERVRPHLPEDAALLSCVKGLDPQGGARVSELVERHLGAGAMIAYAVLSGPNIGREVAAREPTSTVIASADPGLAAAIQSLFTAPWFRAYTSDDVIGVELAGALKNIVAIGAGMADGLRLGQNAKAAFMTRGLAEITRVGVFAGANPLTFAGLAGVGDLIATCNSVQSRNHFVGEQLARGRSLADITGNMDMVAEGVDTTRGARALASRLGIEMPIAEAMHRVLFEGLSVKEGLERLMSRQARHELWGLGRAGPGADI